MSREFRDLEVKAKGGRLGAFARGVGTRIQYGRAKDRATAHWSEAFNGLHGYGRNSKDPTWRRDIANQGKLNNRAARLKRVSNAAFARAFAKGPR